MQGNSFIDVQLKVLIVHLAGDRYISTLYNENIDTQAISSKTICIQPGVEVVKTIFKLRLKFLFIAQYRDSFSAIHLMTMTEINDMELGSFIAEIRREHTRLQQACDYLALSCARCTQPCRLGCIQAVATTLYDGCKVIIARLLSNNKTLSHLSILHLRTCKVSLK